MGPMASHQNEYKRTDLLMHPENRNQILLNPFKYYQNIISLESNYYV